MEKKYNISEDMIRVLVKKYEASAADAQKDIDPLGHENTYNEAVINTLNEVIDDLQSLLV